MDGFFIYSFFFGVLLLLAPVYVGCDLYLDAAQNRGWFSLSLYHVLRLFGGYAQLKREGIVFHLSKRKAVILPYGEMSNARKRFEVTKGFQPTRVHIVVEKGGAQDAHTVLFAAFLAGAGGILYALLKEKSGGCSFRSRTILHREPCLRASVRLGAVMNGLVLLIALSKKCLEVMIEWMKKRRSTASSNALRKSLRDLSTSTR